MSSAVEAEIAGLFINAKEGEILQTTLEEMGYLQAATPIQTDAHAPSTCAFTGSATAFNKATSSFFGPPAKPTSAITLPITIRQNITNNSDQSTSTSPTHLQHSPADITPSIL
jgi:hypothetical protein